MAEKSVETKAPNTMLTVIEKAVEDLKSSGVLSSNAYMEEDEFANLYYSATNGEGNVIQPPYDQKRLLRMVVENNTLSQCVTAYEVNIDGTGYEIENEDEDTETDEEGEKAEELKDFFKECWIGESFVTQRRKMRRDMEGCGNGYFEVIRNAAGVMVFLRHVQAQTMRIVRLSNPISTKKTITRAGKSFEVNVMIRERAFVQKVAGKLVFFKAFGSSRDLNKDTGEWTVTGERLPAAKRATEIIHFTAIKDVDTPYGVPRWINQTPSVLGSRKAEELNLDFFEYGGIPALLLMIQGGSMAEESKQELIRLMNKGPKAALRAAILEIQSTSGSLDNTAAAKVIVERFGSEQKNDSMYENYDEKCEKRVRSSFRLPPMFLGKAEDYSYATAYASYTVAETQVFAPEREEFDEVINNTIMKEMEGEGMVFRSLPLAVNDATMQLKGIELGQEKVSGEDLIAAINEVVNLNLKFDVEADAAAKVKEKEDRELEAELRRANAGQNPPPTQGDGKPANDPDGGQSQPSAQPAPGGKGSVAVVKIDSMELLELANDWAELLTSENPNSELLKATKMRVETLEKADRETLDRMLAVKMYSHPSRDWEGAADICGCALEILSQEQVTEH